jgi:hypothetical protein
MTFEQVGRLTIPQLMCRYLEKPPDDDRKKVSSYAEYEAELKAQEDAWNSPT